MSAHDGSCRAGRARSASPAATLRHARSPRRFGGTRVARTALHARAGHREQRWRLVGRVERAARVPPQPCDMRDHRGASAARALRVPPYAGAGHREQRWRRVGRSSAQRESRRNLATRATTAPLRRHARWASRPTRAQVTASTGETRRAGRARSASPAGRHAFTRGLGRNHASSPSAGSHAQMP